MNAAGDNGSDANSSDDETPEYYLPITTLDDQVNSDEEEDQDPHPDYEILPNGCLHSGVSSLDLGSETEEDEEEAVEPDGAIERAFTEDERRRHAPLPAENAVRVIESMRRVEFPGPAPEWAGRVSNEQWVERLRRIRGRNSSRHQRNNG